MKRFALHEARGRRELGAGMLAFALGVVVIAYVVICARTGSAWPWLEVVHEDGQRTLLGSLFYFEHAMRELPLDLLLALAIGGSALAILPAGDRPSAQLGRRRVGGLGLVAAFVIATITVGAAWHGGVSAVLDNLLQYHTRPGAALEWGAHWRYHLLSRLALLMLAIGVAGILRLLVGGEGRAIARTGPALVASSLVAFTALTILFAAGPRSLLAPFRDPVYIGHQAREIFTHVLVTLPAAWGFCLLLARHAEHSKCRGTRRAAPVDGARGVSRNRRSPAGSRGLHGFVAGRRGVARTDGGHRHVALPALLRARRHLPGGSSRCRSGLRGRCRSVALAGDQRFAPRSR